jgi:hypothetical protein
MAMHNAALLAQENMELRTAIKEEGQKRKCSTKLIVHEGRGPYTVYALIFTKRAGKQNQSSHLETISTLRNKRPLICMLSGLPSYLLCRGGLGDGLSRFQQVISMVWKLANEK